MPDHPFAHWISDVHPSADGRWLTPYIADASAQPPIWIPLSPVYDRDEAEHRAAELLAYAQAAPIGEVAELLLRRLARPVDAAT
mgnify:CR=1 FL=1